MKKGECPLSMFLLKCTNLWLTLLRRLTWHQSEWNRMYHDTAQTLLQNIPGLSKTLLLLSWPVLRFSASSEGMKWNWREYTDYVRGSNAVVADWICLVCWAGKALISLQLYMNLVSEMKSTLTAFGYLSCFQVFVWCHSSWKPWCWHGARWFDSLQLSDWYQENLRSNWWNTA